MVDYTVLPEHIRGSAERYIEYGILPGPFLQAIICNDLRESFTRADDTNIEKMFDIVLFFYNKTPLKCRGSEEKMKAWIEEKRKG